MLSSIYSLLQLGCLFYLIYNRSSESPNNPTVNIVVNTTAAIAHIDDDYICATLDLWPSDKCDYDACSWGKTSILNLDLNNQILSNAVKAFSPLKIRLGGTLQDKLLFQTDVQLPCNPFIKNASEMFGFTSGCLSMARWDEINMFFKQTGVVHTFGLNALIGKTINPGGLTVGAWDPSNAEALMRYTLNKGYNIYGWELGNEVNQNGVGTSITAQQYATDVDTLHNLVERVYETSPIKPIVLGPGGFFQTGFFAEFVSKTTSSLQAISHHMYTLGAGDDPGLLGKILDPVFLDEASWAFSNLQQIIRNTRTPAVAWVSEAGGAYNSGQDHVTNAFVMSFWYLDQLGMAATYDTKTYCRQSLIGGNYGLLNTADFVPNPDYYSALLWHRLMGKQVLSTSVLGVKTLRAYTHCSKQSGITMLLINLDRKETLQVSVSTETGPIVAENQGPVSRKSKLGKMQILRETTREEYHLTAPNGDLSSQTMFLNGQALTLDPSGGIPLLVPATVEINDPIIVAPFSIVYVHLPSVVSDACQM